MLLFKLKLSKWRLKVQWGQWWIGDTQWEVFPKQEEWYHHSEEWRLLKEELHLFKELFQDQICHHLRWDLQALLDNSLHRVHSPLAHHQWVDPQWEDQLDHPLWWDPQDPAQWPHQDQVKDLLKIWPLLISNM